MHCHDHYFDYDGMKRVDCAAIRHLPLNNTANKYDHALEIVFVTENKFKFLAYV